MADAHDTDTSTWATTTLDAGDMGCGELVMLLRVRLRAMPGQVLRVIARDGGAPEDLPAWCRMTRNDLVRHDPATHSFWIRSRADWP
ncbi:sulfurtransferase TusA family protein [Azospirillum sp. B4]|uniref:sulfurtransferase TusA family protein n=1 Tax=Azospirillum sp. B4 TaxID=95605 RepID=UPI000348AC05|nr:sulfurtransferase TusA family protein [Azospirillum sp. B4]